MTSKILRADGVTYLSGIKTVTFHETVNADVNLRPGCVSSSYIEVECFGAQSSAPSAGEALTYYQTVNGTDTLIGIFYAQPSIPTKNSYAFTAYDAAYKLEADFSDWLNANQSNFPYTVYQLVSQACTIAGVTLGSSSWSLSTESVNAFYADGITCRDILQYAAEIGCKFVRCHTDGNLYFDWYSAVSNKRIYPSSGTSGSEIRYAYKQDGLTYANYDTTAVARVAVHPVGEDDVSYYYPTNVQSGNTLEITNNAFLYGATSTLMSTVAQTIYSAMTSLGTYRPFEASLFPNENPFRAGQTVPVTDAQGVSFNTIIMSMKVSESEARVESTGNEVYTEYAIDTAKKLIQLAADIVQINKLKVDWAEINQIFANDITVTGQLHSSDYVYEAGKIYANSGMGMDFGDKRFNTPNFGITPDGNVYAQGGQISGFNIRKGDSFQDGYGFPRVIPSVYKTDGTSSTNYTFLDGILEAVDAGYAVYSVPKTNTISSATYNFLNLWFKYTSSVMVAYTGVLNYYDSNNNLLDSDSFSVVPVGSVTVIPKYNLFMNCDHMTVRINYGANAKVQTAFFYGYNYALYTDVPRIGQGANNIYVGNDGISAGTDIIITPDGVIASGQLDTIGNVNVKGETFPTTDATTPYLRFRDSSDVSWGYSCGFRNSGSTRGGLLLSGGYSGYASNNQLGLLTGSDGTPFVYLTNPDSWLSALNLLSSTTTSTLADIASSGSNTTLTSASYAKWGKIGMVHLVMTRSVNSGTNVDINVAQIVSGKRPAIITSATVRYTGANVKSYISTAGVVYINTPTSIPSGTDLVIDAIYVLA